VEELVKGINGEFRDALKRSRTLYEKASRIFPGGVTHDSRYCTPFPIYASRAEAGRKWDVDGREYVDLWMGHGALMLGHCYPDMVAAVTEQVARGTHYGACHELEVEWGEWVMKLIPTAERVRFTSSGTEATMMALRLARTFTGKRKVLKFFGHFHGWHDNLIVGVMPPFDEPVPAGVLREVADTVCLCPPNQIDQVEVILDRDDDIACVILEPTGATFGVAPLRPGFLEELRRITIQHDVLLIFDEVVTGFRCSTGGAQAHYNVKPDLTSLAKILAGGLPGGCLTGRQDIMDLLAFRGDREWDTCRKMPHQGTFNANPVSAAAGIATLKAIEDGIHIARANRNGEILRNRLNGVISNHAVDWVVYGDFSGVKFLPESGPMEQSLEAIAVGTYDYRRLKAPDPTLRNAFRATMQLEGVDLNGLTGLTASVHTEEDLDHVVDAFDRTLDRLKRQGLIGG
jgi:glutamate-1-semialdehyde 2,1-aminomutase